MDIRSGTIFGREVIVPARPSLRTQIVSTFLHSVKLAALKSKNQEIQHGNGLSNWWPSFSIPSSSFFDLLPRASQAYRKLCTEAANPLAVHSGCIHSCSPSLPRPGSEWPQTPVGSLCEGPCIWDPDTVLIWLMCSLVFFCWLLKEVGREGCQN